MRFRTKRRALLAHLDTLTQVVFERQFGADGGGSEDLGSYLEFLTSGSRGWAAHYADHGQTFLRIQNVRRDALLMDDVAYVNAPNSAEATRTRVKAGDVLLSITADLGRTGVIPADLGEAYISQHLAILRAPALNPRFLSAYLSSPAGQRQITKKDRGATKAGLNFDDVRSIRIPRADRQRQDLFAAQANAIDAERATVHRALAAADELFAAIQSRAFSGEL